MHSFTEKIELSKGTDQRDQEKEHEKKTGEFVGKFKVIYLNFVIASVSKASFPKNHTDEQIRSKWNHT